ncbi:hypothetical protein S7711_04165 [Stachybotrys chartarum IBT 7711]|uniref:Enoyl reductase (ER) domain-containing protein n=1 Tax=Stachybotrys chartarum (strain CBS 109288 / IBT 7711) TaxID=1280523 RepID=A0A084B6M0_STACB|nr:hypothetical protein S7711_04165 [Stachybotrys chartarum IBT 7711]
MPPTTQRALLQTQQEPGKNCLPLILSTSEPVRSLPSSKHVLVRVRAVALNPTDHKMIANFTSPGNGTGCDFCGTVEATGDGINPMSRISPGARVCGPMFPYSSVKPPILDNQHSSVGAFSEWIVVEASLLLEIPPHWTELQGAALGGVGWSTVALAMSHPAALALTGCPSQPAVDRKPVLVYGGGTATGTMACQLLSLSGYAPIAVSQTHESSKLAQHFGAAKTIHSGGEANTQVRHVLDCITDPQSVRLSFAAIARTGGRYACLEHCRDSWKTRRMVQVKEIMGFDVLGRDVDLGGPSSAYTRKADREAVAIGRRWAVEMQALLDQGMVQPHPSREVEVVGGACSASRNVAIISGKKMPFNVFHDPQQGAGFVVCVVTIPLCLVATILRFIGTIRASRNILWEDWFALIALIFHLAYTSTFLYRAKLSLCLLYYRLFSVNRKLVVCVYCIAAVQIAWFIAAYLVKWFMCVPVERIWDVTGNTDGCIEIGPFMAGIESVNSLIDFIMIGLAIWIIQSLRMKSSAKWKVSILFAIGGLSGVIGIVKVVQAYDAAYNNVLNPIWDIVQMATSIICCCAPVYKVALPQLSFSKLRSMLSSYGLESSARRSRGLSHADSSVGSERSYIQTSSDWLRLGHQQETAWTKVSTVPVSQRPRQHWESNESGHPLVTMEVAQSVEMK